MSMKTYIRVKSHIVDLHHPVNESEDDHYARWKEAHDWCNERWGRPFLEAGLWTFDMRGGQMPYQFMFVRPRDAMLFKLTWG